MIRLATDHYRGLMLKDSQNMYTGAKRGCIRAVWFIWSPDRMVRIRTHTQLCRQLAREMEFGNTDIRIRQWALGSNHLGCHQATRWPCPRSVGSCGLSRWPLPPIGGDDFCNTTIPIYTSSLCAQLLLCGDLTRFSWPQILPNQSMQRLHIRELSLCIHLPVHLRYVLIAYKDKLPLILLLLVLVSQYFPHL